MYTYPVVHIQQEGTPTLADKIWYNTLSSFMMWMECLQNSAGNRLITGAVPMKLEFYLANELDTYTIIQMGEGVGLPFKEEIHIRMQVVTPPNDWDQASEQGYTHVEELCGDLSNIVIPMTEQ